MLSVAGVSREVGLCLRVIQSSGSVTSSRAVTNRLSSRERDTPACSTWGTESCKGPSVSNTLIRGGVSSSGDASSVATGPLQDDVVHCH